MAKKEKSLLGLAPLAQSPSFGDTGQMVALGSLRPANRDEQWVLNEHHKQVLIMESFEVKAVQAMKLIAEIHKEGVATFDETTAYILSIKEDKRDKEHQAYVDEFCIRGIQMMGRHLLATMEVAATNVGVEVHRSLYPPSPQEPPGLLKRLFG